MEPQLGSPHTEKLFIGIIIGLLLGGGGGYYAGWIIGQTKGIETAMEMAEQVPATPTAKATVQANPLQDIKTNPLDGVKVNPFE